MLFYSAVGAILLALTHYFAYKFEFSNIPRSKWLSMAGGVAVSYVFIHLLPELEEWQAKFSEINSSIFPSIHRHLYFIALLGLTLFYGMERVAKLSKDSERKITNSELPIVESKLNIYNIHLFSFALYNMLIGYLLVHRDTQSLSGLVLFFVAMLFHFIVNDHGLLDHYQEKYLKQGRYILAAAVILGWTIGALTQVPETVIAILFSILAGSVILNVLKEELPEERKSNFWAFLLGVISYALLLMFT